MATLSILGLYNFDNTILNGFMLPSGLNLDTLKALILSEAAELEILYPNPDIFKAILSAWSHSMVSNWFRIITALDSEYSPIENYNRTETHTDNYNRNLTENGSSANTSSGNSENATKKAAFNSDTLVDTDAENTSEENTSNTTVNTTYGGNDSRNITISAHGNIGVTTNQTMITSEINMRAKYNIYQIIVNDFIDKFCVGVY